MAYRVHLIDGSSRSDDSTLMSTSVTSVFTLRATPDALESPDRGRNDN